MPSMTMTEKFFARASGKASVRSGEFVYPDPALVFVHDTYLPAVHKELDQLGYKRISNPERLVGVTDHEVLFTNPGALRRSQLNQKIMDDWKGGRYYGPGQGGHGHVFPMEDGLVRAGMFIAAYDMHASNFGAVGAYAMTVGTDISVVLATGTKLSRVPETILIELQGDFPRGVHARDVGFRLSHDLTSNRYGYSVEGAVVEFQGPTTAHLNAAARVGFINTLTEMSAANVLFPPMLYDGTPVPELAALPSAPDAQFRGRIQINLAAATPQIALPGAPNNAAEISEAVGTPIQHTYIGACGSSQYEDFSAAATALQGKKLAKGVRLFIVPGSVKIANRLMSAGIAQTFTDAGAIILPSGCGPCAGGLMGLVGPGEGSMSTAATNSHGRMGSMEADYFLGSPLSVVAAAVTGKITDPREIFT
jgi:3-isopropylmalate/(R)-2-methylmalate dehydratase large subunit